MMRNKSLHILKTSFKLLIVALLLQACTSKPVILPPDNEDLVISQIVEQDEMYSEFDGLLKSTGISSLLSVRGPFTLFLPANDAMNAYYAENNISSYTDLSAEEQTNLVMNHIIDAEIMAGGIGLGALPEVNGIGDYLVTEFEGADIIVNKYSRIIDQDIVAANGIVHEINKVLKPVTRSVFDVLADDPSYSIFTQGLEKAGLKDTLQIITFPYGNKVARARYTILAVADTTFQRFGINSVDDLIAKYTDDLSNITDINNEFYRYMEYHCLAETRYLSDLELGRNTYPVLSFDNYVAITVDDDYKINEDGQTKKYTAFYIDKSNNPGKNGTIHTIGDLLPVIEPNPTTFKWETTDHFDMKQLDCYGETYGRFFDGQNDFANIKWQGSYLLYYFKDPQGGIDNHDMLSMQGWWWCEVTTPKIMKGKYNITSNLWANWVDYAVYIDGENTALINRADAANSTSWGEVEWDSTETHKIKVISTTPGILFWDYITFTPSN